MANWYIAPSPLGNDANPGTFASPWATLYKGCTDPGVNETDELNIATGVYNETHQCVLPDGVGIVGAGIGSTIINMTYHAGYPCLKLESYGEWGNPAYGNQRIIGCTFDGQLTGTVAVMVNFRSNVEIYQCEFKNFATRGVVFWGMPNWEWGGSDPYEAGDAPDYWCTGNKFYANIVTNCAIYSSGGEGNLCVGQQDGMQIYGNVITQTARAAGSNGYGIKYHDNGWNKNCQIYGNTITIAPCYTGQFDFAIEWWYERGGCDIFDNVIQGCIDIDVADKGVSDYSINIHDNIIGFASQQDHDEIGIDLEANINDLYVFNNEFKFVSSGIIVSQIWPIGGHAQQNNDHDIYIYSNKFIELGINAGGWTFNGIFGIFFPDSDTGDEVTDFYIWNNTIVANGNDAGAATDYSVGIGLPQGSVTNDFHIHNNIIEGFDTGDTLAAPIWGNTATTNTNVKITHNCFYGNGNGNALLLSGGYAEGAGFDHSTGNITVDPLLDANYKIDSSSPAYHAGLDVDNLYDYDYELFDPATPSMGCYEYVYLAPPVSPPISPPYVSPPNPFSPPYYSPPDVYPPAPIPSGSSSPMTVGAIKALVSNCIEGIYLRWWFNGWHYFNFTNGYEISMKTESMGTQVTNFFSVISKVERPTKIKSEYSYQVSLEGITVGNIEGFTGLLIAEKVEQYESGLWREVEITAGDHPIKDEGTNGYILTFEVTRKDLPDTPSVYQKTLKLYLGDTLCDIDDNEVIPINKQVNDIAEMQDRQSDFTAEFKIRKTRAMKALFELSGEVGANTLFPYEVQECRLIQDGIEIITVGKLILIHTDDQYYYVSIISGNVNFFKQIEKKKLADLTLASMIHTWNVATMVASHADTSPETCFVYPLIEPSEDGSISPLTDNGDRIDMYGGWIWCFCRIKCIWDEIIANSGFTCTGGELLNSDTFLKLFIPISTRELNNTNEWLFASWWVGARLALNNDVIGSTQFMGTALIKGNAAFLQGYYTAQFTGSYTFRVYVVCGGGLPTLRIYKNGILQGNMTVVSSDGFVTATYELKLSATAGQYFQILTDSVYYYYYSYNIAKIEGALIDYGSLVSPVNHLPDMTQTDFIKMICNMFGLVPDVTAKDKKINFWNYQELYDNIPIARDWSAYLSERDDDVEFKFGDYAQNNYLKYKDSEDVIKNNGQGIMEIDDATLPEKKDVIELPVSYSDEVTVMINTFSVDISRIGFNKLDAAGTAYEKNKTIDPRIVYIDHTRAVGAYHKTFRLRPAVAAGGEVSITDPKKASSIEISFSSLVSNYASLSRLLTKTNIRKAKFNLPVYEVAGLKHNIPIYLSQYKAYFYVNKIENYVAGQLCTVPLIKL